MKRCLLLVGVLLTLWAALGLAGAEATATPIALNQTIEVPNATWDNVYFSFTPAETGYYAFYSSGTCLSNGMLYESLTASSPIRTDYGCSKDGTNFLLGCKLSGGRTYYFAASSKLQSGAFSVTLSKAATSGSFSGGISWSYDTSGRTLTLSGSGAMSLPSGGNAPWYAFMEDITTVKVGKGITTLASRAFYSAESLRSVTLPEGLTSIGEYAFFYCEQLAEIALPSTMRTVEQCAFSRCEALKWVTLNAGLETLGYEAFAYCGKLESVALPSSLKSLGSGCFRECSRLTSAAIPGSVGEVPGSAFSRCYKLSSVTLSGGISKIGASAFYDCVSLETVVLPASLKSVGENAFVRCNALARVSYAGAQWSAVAVEKGNGLLKWRMNDEVLDSGACGDGLTWTLTGDLTLTISGNGAMQDFEGVRGSLGTYDSSTAGWAHYREHVAALKISNGVTRVGNFAFIYFTALRQATLPDSVTEFGQYAFYQCAARQMNIPAGLTHVGYAAMSHMSNLPEVLFPESLTTIDEWAFGVSGFRSMYLPASVTALPSRSFYSTSALVTLYYGGTQAQWDKVSVGTGNDGLDRATVVYGGIPAASRSGSCGTGVSWTLDGQGVLTISGSGPMADYALDRPANVSVGLESFTPAVSTAPWGDQPQRVTKIVVQRGVTRIGDYAFYNCYNCASVSLSDTVAEIGEYAFSALSRLPALSLPDSVETLSRFAFVGCKSLASIRLSKSLKALPDYLFEGCLELASLEIPEGVESVGRVFSSTPSDIVVTFPASLRSVSGTMALDTGSHSTSVHRQLHFLGPVPRGLDDRIWEFSDVYCRPEDYGDYKATLLTFVSKMSADLNNDIIPGTLTSSSQRLALSQTDLVIDERRPNASLAASVPGVSSPSVAWSSTDEATLTVSSGGAIIATGLSGRALVSAEASWNGYRSIAFCRVRFIHSQFNSQMLDTLPTQGIKANYLTTSSTSYTGLYDDYGGTSGYAPAMYVESDTGNASYKALKSLTDSLVAGCTTDRQKTAKILSWVASNVTYQAPPLCIGETPEQAYWVYANKIGNCQGFTKLAGYMLSLARIPVGVVVNQGHMWNVVYLDGQWVMLDAQYGSGAFYANYGDSLHAEIQFIIFAQGDLIFIVDRPGEIKLAGVGVNAMKEGRAGVTSVTVPDFVDTVFGDSLVYCDNLTSVTIPRSVATVSESAFSKNSKATIRCYKASAAHLYALSKGLSYELLDGEERVLALPAALTAIESASFAGLNVDRVIIPPDVTSIADDAFGSARPILQVYPNSYAHTWALTHGFDVVARG